MEKLCREIMEIIELERPRMRSKAWRRDARSLLVVLRHNPSARAVLLSQHGTTDFDDLNDCDLEIFVKIAKAVQLSDASAQDWRGKLRVLPGAYRK